MINSLRCFKNNWNLAFLHYLLECVVMRDFYVLSGPFSLNTLTFLRNLLLVSTTEQKNEASLAHSSFVVSAQTFGSICG